MFYEIQDQVVVFNHGDIKLLQPINPLTGSAFISKTDQVQWAEETINGLFNTTKATLTYLNATNQVIKNLYVDKPCKAKFTIDFKDIISVKAKLCMAGNDLCKEIMLNFVDGVAIVDITFSVSGEYYFILDEPIMIIPADPSDISIEITEEVSVEEATPVEEVVEEATEETVIIAEENIVHEEVVTTEVIEPEKIAVHFLHELYEYKRFVAKQ